MRRSRRASLEATPNLHTPLCGPKQSQGFQTSGVIQCSEQRSDSPHTARKQLPIGFVRHDSEPDTEMNDKACSCEICQMEHKMKFP